MLSENPRATMACLPWFVQPLLTLLTGRPLPHEAAWRLSPWHHLLPAAVSLLGGVSISSLVVSIGICLWALPIAWLLTLHGARKLRAVIMHQCSHSNFIGDKKFDQTLGKAISIVLMSEEFFSYKKSHVSDHHSSRHQTISDPTVAFLFFKLGLRPGMHPAKMWIRLFATVISPIYHLQFLWARIHSHFSEKTTVQHRLIFISYWCTIIGIVAATKMWWGFFVAWVVPIWWLYQISAAFRLASKHVFPTSLPKQRSRETLGMFTLGIFIGRATPSSDLPIWQRIPAWVWWSIEMGFFHLVCRLAVLVGDGPCHDHHHRYPNCEVWSDYIHNREHDLDAAAKAGMPYQEVWGLHHAIHRCFQSLSVADPGDYPVVETTLTSSQLLLAADD